MALIPYNGIFDSIEEFIASPFLVESVGLLVPMDGADAQLSPRQAWNALYGPQRDESLCESVWRQAIVSAQQEPAGPGMGQDGPRRLLAVWLALPRMSRTIYYASARLRVDRKDVEAEVLLALLDALHVVDSQQLCPSEQLLRTARRQVWRAVRSTARETPVADIAGLAADRQSRLATEQAQTKCLPTGRPDCVDETAWEVQITPPDRPDGLAAPLHFTMSRMRIEGERLGSLAEELGLHNIVYRARRPGLGKRIGTLSLRSVGSRR